MLDNGVILWLRLDNAKVTVKLYLSNLSETDACSSIVLGVYVTQWN